MNKIITIAGGGSTYTPGVVKAILARYDEFHVEEIRLYDIDGGRQENVAVIVKEVVKEMQPSVKLTLTTDPKEAFTDADFVFAQIRVGKYAMREQDEKIPLANGVVGQETCGPGGLAYGLRTIYPMVEILDEVARYAKPNHWILNYSNPAAIVAKALKTLRPDARIINICDMPVAILEAMATILETDYNKIVPQYFGLNHFGWFTSIKVDGQERLPELLAYTKENGYLTHTPDEQHYEKSWNETYENAKHMVNMFPEYLPNTYLQYYLLGDNVLSHSDPQHTRANEVQERREKILFDAIAQVKETGVYDSEAFKVGVHGSFIIDLAIALSSDQTKRFLLIVENNGAVANLPADTMVEVPCYVNQSGIEVTSIGQIPTFYKGLIEQQAASEKLIVEAAIENSYDKALQAFAMNKTIPHSNLAKKILDEMIIANAAYWPELR